MKLRVRSIIRPQYKQLLIGAEVDNLLEVHVERLNMPQVPSCQLISVFFSIYHVVIDKKLFRDKCFNEEAKFQI
jgi:hypothetical protein